MGVCCVCAYIVCGRVLHVYLCFMWACVACACIVGERVLHVRVLYVGVCCTCACMYARTLCGCLAYILVLYVGIYFM